MVKTYIVSKGDSGGCRGLKGVEGGRRGLTWAKQSIRFTVSYVCKNIVDSGAQFLSKITTYIACQLAISMCMNESALSVKYLIWIRGGLYYHPGANNGQSKGQARQKQLFCK